MSDLELDIPAPHLLIQKLFNEGKIPDRLFTDGSLDNLIYLWSQYKWTIDEFQDMLEKTIDFEESMYGLE